MYSILIHFAIVIALKDAPSAVPSLLVAESSPQLQLLQKLPKCRNPPNVTHATISFETRFGSYFRYTCDAGYYARVDNALESFYKRETYLNPKTPKWGNFSLNCECDEDSCDWVQTEASRLAMGGDVRDFNWTSLKYLPIDDLQSKR